MNYDTDNKEKDKKPKEDIWMTPQAVILYLVWEQCWYIRNKKMERCPKLISSLYMICKQEYSKIGPYGKLLRKYLMEEKSFYDSQKNDKKAKTTSSDASVVYHDMGLLSPEDFLNKTNGNINDLKGEYTKKIFNLSFENFVEILIKFERIGYVYIRPLFCEDSYSTKGSSSPENPLAVWFDDTRGTEFHASFFCTHLTQKLEKADSVLGICQIYHNQRFKRYVYLSESFLRKKENQQTEEQQTFKKRKNLA